MEIFAVAPVPGVGPLTLVQVVTPVTPVIAHVPTPVGAMALVGPDTVAVKLIVSPRFAVAPVLSVTRTVGFAFATVVVYPEVGVVAE